MTLNINIHISVVLEDNRASFVARIIETGQHVVIDVSGFHILEGAELFSKDVASCINKAVLENPR